MATAIIASGAVKVRIKNWYTGESLSGCVLHLMICRRRISIEFILAIGVLILSSCERPKAPTIQEEKSAALEPVSVVVKPAELRKISRVITCVARCEPIPEMQAVLTPVIEGRVESILAKLGERVKANQPIVQLGTTLARADLAEKQAARDSLVASLKALQSAPRPEEQNSAKLAVEQADVAVRRAQALLDRLLPLRARSEVPEAQVYEAEEGLKQAQLQKETAQSQLEVLMLAPRHELIDEAKSKIKVAAEAVKTAEARLALHTITTPIDGILENLSCRIGQTVSVGNVVANITDNQKVLIVAWLAEKWRPAISTGNDARIELRTPSSAAKQNHHSVLTIAGRVAFVGKTADAQTGNVPVHFVVDNHSEQLLIGQTMTINVLLDSSTATLSVPATAVHDEEEGPTLRVVRDEKAVVLHPKTGASDSQWVSVLNTDLKSGEPVVISGGYNLPDDAPVKMQVAVENVRARSETNAAHVAE